MTPLGKDPEDWSSADKFMVGVEITGFKDTELSAITMERGLFTVQQDRWRQAVQNINPMWC